MTKAGFKKIFAAMATAALISSAGSLTVLAVPTYSESTNVKYQVSQGYEWTIHSDIDFGSDKGVNKSVELTNNSISVTKNIIPDGTKLQITVNGSGTDNAFTISNGDTDLDYTVAKTGETAISSGDTVLELEAGTNTGAQSLTFTLNTGSAEAEVAGTYTGEVTYTAAIVAK